MLKRTVESILLNSTGYFWLSGGILMMLLTSPWFMVVISRGSLVWFWSRMLLEITATRLSFSFLTVMMIGLPFKL